MWPFSRKKKAKHGLSGNTRKTYYRRVRTTAMQHRGIDLTEDMFDLLDYAIIMQILNDGVFTDSAVISCDLLPSDYPEEVIVDVNDDVLDRATIEEIADATESVEVDEELSFASSFTPSQERLYTPDPEPVRSYTPDPDPEPVRSSGSSWGSSSDDSGSSYSSSDSGGGSDDY